MTKKNPKQIILAGNPNVGKSTLFSLISDQYVEVSNYAGTTIDILKVNLNEDTVLIDTPGIYALDNNTDESLLTKDILATLDEAAGDYIINIINANTLEKDLFLTLQLVDMGLPLICLINQTDNLDKAGIIIKYDELARLLGIMVLPVSAYTHQNIDIIRELIFHATDVTPGLKANQSPKLTHEKHILLTKLAAKNIKLEQEDRESLLLLEEDSQLIAKYELDFETISHLHKNKIFEGRRERIDRLLAQVYRQNYQQRHFLNLINQFLLHPITGTLWAFVLAWLVLYQFLGVLVAGHIVDFLENILFGQHINPFVIKVVNYLLPYTNSVVGFAKALLVGEYGLLPLTITYTLAILLPLTWFFYFIWGMLEDCGYLPRLSVLADSLLKTWGLNGRAIIPLVLGLGCVTMAMVTTRLLGSRREQLIMMILLSIAVPCSAQLGIIQGLLAKTAGFQGWCIWLVTLLLVMSVSGFLANKLIKGKATPLILDLPILRMPRLSNILKKANQKTKYFLKESVSVFAIASLVITALDFFHVLPLIIKAFEPFIVHLLHLPKEVALSFLMGMVRRDFGAFGLLDIPLSSIQVIVASVSLTLFVPCIATVGIMIKERNWPTATAIWSLSWFMGFGIGFLLTTLLEFLKYS